MNALDKALYDYHNTDKTIATILKETGLNKSYFYRHLDYKEKSRKDKKVRKYNFNINNIIEDSHDKYYWLGFISADGAIVKNSLVIELKDIDKKHLIKFNNFMENTNPLAYRINNNKVSCVRAKINSKELIQYLTQYNIVQNNSKTFEIPESKIPNEYIMDFIRGIIDGDGCIRINNHQQISLSFCSASKKCVEQLANIIQLENKIRQDVNTFAIQVTGNKKAKLILDKIYETSTENTRLDRKYSIYKTLN